MSTQSVARIAAETIDRKLDHPQAITARIAPFAKRFGLAPSDGAGLLDELLATAGHDSRGAATGEAGE
jgi:hypothetical protein